MRITAFFIVLCGVVAQLPVLSFGQSGSSGISTVAKTPDSGPSTSSGQPQTATAPAIRTGGGRMGIGVGVRVSSLGIGGEVALAVTRRSNLRGGFNMFDYSRSLTHDGINYAGSLSLRSVEAHYDWYPWGGFHLSPGVMAYNGNSVSANATVSGGQTFTLNGVQYGSDPNDPVSGSGKLSFNKAAPTMMMGFGNLVRRRGRRFAVNFEIGAAYHGTPRATFSLGGGVCNYGTANCESIASDPEAQANVLAQQGKFNHDVSPYKIYPLISLGFGYRFR